VEVPEERETPDEDTRSERQHLPSNPLARPVVILSYLFAPKLLLHIVITFSCVGPEWTVIGNAKDASMVFGTFFSENAVDFLNHESRNSLDFSMIAGNTTNRNLQRQEGTRRGRQNQSKIHPKLSPSAGT
jgi:hypothetical protein